ncbi:MAG TPA: gephyrin-like molybdotransferase Glp [Beutenbergiaceae bacterium]|nr:gephyrin-like molybdotransferase Glp [Beutenbergiaceae bacterium]
MTEVPDHLTRVLDVARPLPPLEVRLADAVGCVLAQDVYSDIDVPARDLAGQDGYAVRSRDVEGAGTTNPVQLRVLDDLRAGATNPGAIVDLTAVRIASGAPVPAGADAVIALDDTDRGDAVVSIFRGAAPGENIRPAAADIASGEVALSAGVRIDARHIALLAGIGRNRVTVHPRPRVVVVSVGDELIEPGRPGSDGDVFDANGHALATAVQAAGGSTFRVAAVPDEHTHLRETLEDQLVRADLIITTGGLSYGANDTVKDVLSPLGTVRFDNVLIAPGRQFGVGEFDDATPILCLPGDPVSAQIGFEVFVRPALLVMAGYAEIYRPTVSARLASPWRSPAGRREFVPARLSGRSGEYDVTPTGPVGAAHMSALAKANALLIIPPHREVLDPGAMLNCMVLSEW